MNPLTSDFEKTAFVLLNKNKAKVKLTKVNKNTITKGKIMMILNYHRDVVIVMPSR